MRIVFSFGAALFIAACSTSSTPPGGTCATRASAEFTALQAAIQTSETNIARGYSVTPQVGVEGTQIEEVRVPVNVGKERRNLADLKARLGPVQAQTDAALAACNA